MHVDPWASRHLIPWLRRALWCFWLVFSPALTRSCKQACPVPTQQIGRSNLWHGHTSDSSCLRSLRSSIEAPTWCRRDWTIKKIIEDIRWCLMKPMALDQCCIFWGCCSRMAASEWWPKARAWPVGKCKHRSVHIQHIPSTFIYLPTVLRVTN